MTCTYDTSTDIGMVRLRINDRVCVSAIYTDEEIQAFLTAEHGVLRASAAALETQAGRYSIEGKAIKALQFSVDTTKRSGSLLALAKAYRDQALIEDAATGGNFDIAEFVDDQFAARERLYKEFLREAA